LRVTSADDPLSLRQSTLAVSVERHGDDEEGPHHQRVVVGLQRRDHVVAQAGVREDLL
jgi:hypothetical protein